MSPERRMHDSVVVGSRKLGSAESSEATDLLPKVPASHWSLCHSGVPKSKSDPVVEALAICDHSERL